MTRVAPGDRRTPSRRQVLAGGAALGLLGALGACTGDAGLCGPRVAPDGSAVQQAAARRRGAGARVRQATLRARAGSVDLGGRTVRTWFYGDGVPGPLLRGSAGEVLRVRVDNQLPQPTAVHWHGLAIRNDMDGVPNLTQPEIAPGAAMVYEFPLPRPGTYFYHSHHGVQRERGLYGPLIIDDPREPGDYDEEFIVVLDDWTDGTGAGSGPEDILRYLRDGGQSAKYRTRVTAGEVPAAFEPEAPMGAPAPIATQLAGDVQYPFHLLGGRLPTSPRTFSTRPGRRARLRVINASGTTVYRVALGGHRLTVTHSDGYRSRRSPSTRCGSPPGSATTCRSLSVTAPSRWPPSPKARAPRRSAWSARPAAPPHPPTPRPPSSAGRCSASPTCGHYRKSGWTRPRRPVTTPSSPAT